MKKKDELTSWAEEQFTPDALPVSRNPLKAQSARNRFLSKVQEQNRAVSFSEDPRLNHTGMQQKPAKWQKKENRTMIGQVLTAVAIIVSLLGGTGAATVYASQSSIPGEFLYPVKTWSEDVQMDLTANPQDKLNLSLDLTDERLSEIQQLVDDGTPLSEPVLPNLQQQLDTTLNLLGQVPEDANMQQVLTRLQTQTQLMDQSQDMQQDQLMLQVRDMLQTRIQAVEAVGDQYQIENQNQQQYQTPGPKEPLQQQQQFQATLTPQDAEATVEPQGNGNGNSDNAQQNSTVSATQGGQSGNGQGNGLHLTLTPAASQSGKGNGGKN